MITYILNEYRIVASIDTGVGYLIEMEYTCNTKLYAKLLYDQLRLKQYSEVEAFARKNYNEGFDDHKKRKPRRDWHPSVLK